MSDNNKIELDEENLEKVAGGGGVHYTCSAKCSCGQTISGDINYGFNQVGAGIMCKCGTKYQFDYLNFTCSLYKVSGPGELVGEPQFGSYCFGGY